METRRFHLVRLEDVSGVSGTGLIAEGIQFHDGQVVLSWFGKHHCVSIWPDIEEVKAIHGHEGLTRVVWLEEKGYFPAVGASDGTI